MNSKMKKTRKIKLTKALWMIGLFMAFVSCNDDDNEVVVVEITEQDVAEVIAASLSEEDGGFAADIDNLLEEVEEDCGYVKTGSLTDQDTFEEGYYDVAYELSMEVVCDDANQFVQLNYSYKNKREADLVRLSVDSEVESEWIFLDDGELYLLNGAYAYNGQEAFKIRDENTFTTALDVSSNTLMINDHGDFLEGTLAVSYSIVSTSGDERAESGSLTLTTTNVGLLDISSFEYLYEIDIKTGDVQQIER